ncbi:magnesium transporter [Telmatospirillum sp. J64-1]|uniref:magnesium transporter n=1 Tax=Telmatospirillum sp. J64-1 TaxID=2502183 RepID=UPI002107C52B|nr:magnesium transporter [Telmatospirillum sp. J64-1]
MEQREGQQHETQQQEDFYGLSHECVVAVSDALERGDPESARQLALPLHYSDAADLFERLSPEERRQLVEALRPDFEPEILIELDETLRDEIIDYLGFANLANAIQELDSDDAVWLLDQLDEEEQRRVLESLPPDTQTILLQGLAYPEYSAGRLMARELVAVPAYWTVGETIDYLRASQQVPDEFYDIFVVDPRHRPVGKIGLAKLVRARRPVRLREIMEGDLPTVGVTTDQEEVAFLFRQQDLVSAPVVDPAGRLVGVITIDDVVDVIDEEAADDMLRLAGVGDTDLFAPATTTAMRRIRWLVITLCNTILASYVISHFEATIEQIVALAVLMPIVAAMGGNAGMQVVTVTVRALATKELGHGNVGRVVAKELAVGGMNGLVFAAIMGSIAFLWFGRMDLGMVLAAAMIFNMLWAGMAGTVIPLTLNRLKIDPALAAGPFLTTTTDVLGFFAFLGLATLFLV